MNFDLFQNVTKKKGLLELVSEADRKVYLEPPLLITEEMALESPKYRWLYDAYNSDEEVTVDKQMAISLINYLATQNKVVVRISQKVLERLTTEDVNWKIKKEFTDKSYNAACSILSEMGIKRIAWATIKKPAILFTFPDSPIYEYYNGELEDDLTQIFKQNNTAREDFKIPEYLEQFSQFL